MPAGKKKKEEEEGIFQEGVFLKIPHLFPFHVANYARDGCGEKDGQHATEGRNLKRWKERRPHLD